MSATDREPPGSGRAPARIVSLVPSTTESVCVLGAAARLVGCTRYCSEPAGALRDVARVGGTKNPDLAAILSLEPDLVIGNAEENRAEDLEALAARVPTLVQTPRSVPEAARALAALAERLDLAEAAAPFVERVTSLLAEPAPAAGPRVYYAIWRKPWMTVGADTFVADVLARCGARPVGAVPGGPQGREVRYPELAPAEAVAAGVDLVLLASEPWEFDDAQRDDVAASGLFGEADVRLVDGRDFCWHGVRMAAGLARARAALTP